MIRLSICIATFKRADYIGETLASIVPQLTDQTEILILDGASPDNTAEVVGRFAAEYPQVRYVRAETNSGIDADFDRAVGLASGEHCWLFSDDDVLAPDAVATVLAELADGDPDVLIVDAEVRDVHLDHVFEPARLKTAGRRDYLPADRDAFMADAGDTLSFIGCVIIRRSAWLARDRASYYGTLFVHVGVIFQQPPLPLARVLAKPLVRIRMGNAMWSGRAFDIWMFKWPELIWGFAGYSDAAKAKVVAREPWRGLRDVLTYRAYGSFTGREYRARQTEFRSGRKRLPLRLILALPGGLAHLLVVAKSALSRNRNSSVVYNLLIASRHSNPISRGIGRLIGYSLPARGPRT
ncbi:glycosyltransferase family 2 protein [Sphingomonas sp.]|jgi:glycosyltransferase involved in cell wall biosynthesis|uniref:glycosyltransferase family 2 protein n=1 Tax=Sphingomonas sp. TaxID=28214 RepID=UPI002D801D51|nr:glycosyltransferase family 2 protein [Sphingomonas sp.]HEU0044523.1 glycosyltransferase family 2 protein [Sphingomonas sp.]